MAHIDPTQPQVEAFAGKAGDKEPVFMLNLLRFREEAGGVHQGDGISGREAYTRYAAETAPHLERVGAEVLWAGECDGALIGPDEDEWDIAAVVRYPSRTAFLEMVGNPEYIETSRLRTGALADSRLIPCGPATLGA